MSLLDDLFEALWTGYAVIAPEAARAYQLLGERGGRNDHVALRTFDLPGVDIDSLDRAFVAEGYEAAQHYELVDRKLVAYHYEHREPSRPALLISALLVDELSGDAQAIIRELVGQVEPGAAAHAMFAASGRPWQLSTSAFRTLRGESEFAAWVAAFGFRASHFAVDAGRLSGTAGLAEVGRLLEERGFRLDDKGGAIAGGPAELIERAAVLADEVDVELADGTERMPSCTCELVRRHPMADGTPFTGFAPLVSRF